MVIKYVEKEIEDKCIYANEDKNKIIIRIKRNYKIRSPHLPEKEEVDKKRYTRKIKHKKQWSKHDINDSE